MKVADLLTLLSEMPADADVVAKGYEGGVDDIINVQLVKLKRDVNDEWYYGRHEISEDGDVQAVFIQREEREAEEAGDYSKDRHKWLDDQDLDTVVKRIQEKRKSYKKSKSDWQRIAKTVRFFLPIPASVPPCSRIDRLFASSPPNPTT